MLALWIILAILLLYIKVWVGRYLINHFLIVFHHRSCVWEWKPCIPAACHHIVLLRGSQYVIFISWPPIRRGCCKLSISQQDWRILGTWLLKYVLVLWCSWIYLLFKFLIFLLWLTLHLFVLVLFLLLICGLINTWQWRFLSVDGGIFFELDSFYFFNAPCG